MSRFAKGSTNPALLSYPRIVSSLGNTYWLVFVAIVADVSDLMTPSLRNSPVSFSPSVLSVMRLDA